MPPDGPVGMEDVEGPVGTDGEAGVVRLAGSTPLDVLEEKSLIGRLGAAPQLVVSGRGWRSWPKDPRPPLPMYEPRDGVN